MIPEVENRFRSNFEERGELGASLSVWKDGREILTLHQGWADPQRTLPWTSTTAAPAWSATKGPAAVTFLLALENAGFSPHDPVTKVWPELKAAKESGLTFAQLLAHQSGLAALSPENLPTLFSHREVAAALEREQPWWEPGKGHGYHPRTIGFLLDEVVRRVTGGTTLGAYWNETIATPLGIDFRIGDLPLSLLDRLATMVPPRTQRPVEEELAFYRELAKPDSLSLAAFSSPAGMRSLGEINKLEILQGGFPAFGGVGTARGLAKFYQILAQDGIWEGVPVLPSRVVRAVRTPLGTGLDKTLLLPTSFTAGFQTDPVDDAGKKIRRLFGPSATAFGQPGAGGIHAFADSENGLSFAYTMNQMETGLFPNRKSLDLVDALYGEGGASL